MEISLVFLFTVMSFVLYLGSYAEFDNVHKFEWCETTFILIKPKVVGELVLFIILLPGFLFFITLITVVFSIIYPIYKICSIRIR